MPQITQIVPQKKKKNRLNIYLDGQFAFGVDENVLIKNRLVVGLNLSTDQIEKIIKESTLSVFTDKAMKFLASRPKSQKEITDYLAKKIAQKEDVKFSEVRESPLIKNVVAKLQKYGYLNDLEFAKWWVKSRVQSRPRGLALLKYELLAKGIKKEIVENVLKIQIDQKKLARKALEKKLKRWQSLSSFELKKKVYQFLKSRGFDFETIKETFAFLQKAE